MAEEKLKNISEKVQLKLSPELKQIYITGAFGGFTSYDFRLILYNEIPEQTGDDIETIQLVPESKYEVIMSPKTVKELYIWLGNKIKELEDIMGEEIKTTQDDFEALKQQNND